MLIDVGSRSSWWSVAPSQLAVADGRLNLPRFQSWASIKLRRVLIALKAETSVNDYAPCSKHLTNLTPGDTNLNDPTVYHF